MPDSKGGFGQDFAVALGSAVWLAAADAWLMVRTARVEPGEVGLRPLGPLGLSMAGYVLLVLLAVGALAGLAVAFLQSRWVRTPRPWRPAVSAVLALAAVSAVLARIRVPLLDDAASAGRYLTGLLVLTALFILLALSAPALSRRDAEGRSLRRAGRAAAVLTAAAAAGLLAGPVLQDLLLPRSRVAGPLRRLPNVLVLMLDTVRADALSCIDPAGGRTPRIDALAREGTLFRKAVAPAPWTVPSHGSFFTGLFPSEHGAVWEHRLLDQSFHSLPEIFNARGYRTVAFSENPNICKSMGFGHGFESFYELFLGPRRALAPALWEDFRAAAFNRHSTLEYTAESVSHLIRWLRGRALPEGSPPFFAFINLMAGHLPNYARPGYSPAVPPKEAAERAGRIGRLPERFYLPAFRPRPGDLDVLRMFYRGDVAYLDARLGRLFDFLERSALLDSTLVIILSDHGENFGDHHLIEHAFNLYNTVLHVPLILRWPGRVPAGAVRDDVVSTVRLFDTLLLLTGTERRPGGAGPARRSLLDPAPENEVFAESENLVGMMKSVLAGEPAAERFDFAPFDKTLACVYAGGRKLIRSIPGRLELYDTAADWAESRDLAAAEPERVKDLLGRLEAWERSLVRPSIDYTPPVLRRGVEEALKSLGYIR